MNDDNLHSFIEPELEARLVALVLGESSDFEREELERLIAEKPELALFRKRIEKLHGMLRQVGSGEKLEDEEEWKLNDEKRKKVLEVIGQTPAPSQETPAIEPTRKSLREKRKTLSQSVVKFGGAAAAAVLVIGLIAATFLAALPGIQMNVRRDSELAEADREFTKDGYAYFSDGEASNVSLSSVEIPSADISVDLPVAPSTPTMELAQNFESRNTEVVREMVSDETPLERQRRYTQIGHGGRNSEMQPQEKSDQLDRGQQTKSKEPQATAFTGVSGKAIDRLKSPQPNSGQRGGTAKAERDFAMVGHGGYRSTGSSSGNAPISSGHEIDLNLTPEVVEFDGFVNHGAEIDAITDSKKKPASRAFASGGTAGVGQENQITAVNGTVALGSGGNLLVTESDGKVIVQAEPKPSSDLGDKIPVLGDLPHIAPMFQRVEPSKLAMPTQKNAQLQFGDSDNESGAEVTAGNESDHNLAADSDSDVDESTNGFVATRETRDNISLNRPAISMPDQGPADAFGFAASDVSGTDRENSFREVSGKLNHSINAGGIAWGEPGASGDVDRQVYDFVQTPSDEDLQDIEMPDSAEVKFTNFRRKAATGVIADKQHGGTVRIGGAIQGLDSAATRMPSLEAAEEAKSVDNLYAVVPETVGGGTASGSQRFGVNPAPGQRDLKSVMKHPATDLSSGLEEIEIESLGELDGRELVETEIAENLTDQRREQLQRLSERKRKVRTVGQDVLVTDLAEGLELSNSKELESLQKELQLVRAQIEENEIALTQVDGAVATAKTDSNQLAKVASELAALRADQNAAIAPGSLASDVTLQSGDTVVIQKKLAPKKPETPPQLGESITSQEPFSTFSLNVSDASFQLARAALAKNEWPEKERIRIEEFVNAFDYGDPVPTAEEKVAAQIEQAAHPFLQQRNLLRLSMRTATAGRGADTPLRLTFLLDNSGSMERADRQETVRRAFAILAGMMQPQDQVTLISFARQPRLLADKVAGEKANELVNTIQHLPSEGGTNLEAALQLAFEKAQENQLDTAQNRIVLLTDGAANLGDADPERLSQRVETMREAGIAFDAAGIGTEGLNDEILEALTRKGDGRYYLLDSPSAADAGFAKKIAGAFRPAAKNVKVQVEFNPTRVSRYQLLGFEKHRLAKEDFRNDKVDAAELAAEEAGVALYHFEADPEGSGDVGFVSVRFRDMSTGQMVERRWPIPYQRNAAALVDASPALKLASTSALFAAKLKGGPLGDVVALDELSSIAGRLPGNWQNRETVSALRSMIETARELEGK